MNVTNAISFLLFTAIFLGIVFFGLVIYDVYFSDIDSLTLLSPPQNVSAVSDTIVDSYPDGILFYPNIRFPDRRITYYIDSSCSESRATHAREAFGILQENTVLMFTETEIGQIKVSCDSQEQQKEPDSDYFIAGEGGPNNIINASKYYVVTNGTIFIYRETNCRVPVVPIHEILHVLGFRHSTNKASIMYEVSNCNQKITSEIIETINKLYADPQLPDLVINKVSATKHGGLLDFHIEIMNAGLDNSNEIQLMISADGEEITDYEIADLNIGGGRILKVTNLRIPRNSETILFKIDSDSEVLEIDEYNNEAVLQVNE